MYPHAFNVRCVPEHGSLGTRLSRLEVWGDPLVKVSLLNEIIVHVVIHTRHKQKLQHDNKIHMINMFTVYNR